jgi:predicted aminopeptidase
MAPVAAGAQREQLQQLQEAHVQQEAQLLSARAEAAAVQRLRKQLANQSQVQWSGPSCR